MLDLGRMSVEEFRASHKVPVVVVLDNVRSEMNVGSMLRTADAFALERLVLCGITPVPGSAPELHKTALGAEDSVAWQHYADVLQAIADLRDQGYTILSVEQVHGSVSLEQYPIDRDGKYAVILGNEVRGVSQEAVDASDACLELPQLGTKHSLNVACTAAIVMWQFFEKMRL